MHLSYKAHDYKAISVMWPILFWSQTEAMYSIVIMLRYKVISLIWPFFFGQNCCTVPKSLTEQILQNRSSLLPALPLFLMMSSLASRDQETRTRRETVSSGSLSPLEIPSVPKCPKMTPGALKNRKGKDCFFFVHDDAALLPPRGQVPNEPG